MSDKFKAKIVATLSPEGEVCLEVKGIAPLVRHLFARLTSEMIKDGGIENVKCAFNAGVKDSGVEEDDSFEALVKELKELIDGSVLKS